MPKHILPGKLFARLAVLVIGLLWFALSCHALNPLAETPAPRSNTPTGFRETPASMSVVTSSPSLVTASPFLPSDLSALESRIENNLLVRLFKTPGVLSAEGITGISVVSIKFGMEKKPFWIAYSTGMRVYNPPQNHFISIYSTDGTTLREVTYYELACPDILQEGAVSQVDFGDRQAWLMIQSYVGAHGGCFDLLKFDGRTLTSRISHSSDGPSAGEVRDLNSDGVPEVLLNNNISYIFCYACGVVLADYLVYRWENGDVIEVKPIPLDETVSEEVRQINNRALSLKEAELWKDAQQTINQALSMGPGNPLVMWNALYINLIAEARAEKIVESPYPLLSCLFYGDYTCIMDLMRAYPVATLFGVPNPLIKGTVAEGYEADLTRWVIEFTTRTISLQPELAAPYFLRGWVAYLNDPSSSAARMDIERAAQLAPEERLFSESLSCLKDGCPPFAP